MDSMNQSQQLAGRQVCLSAPGFSRRRCTPTEICLPCDDTNHNIPQNEYCCSNINEPSAHDPFFLCWYDVTPSLMVQLKQELHTVFRVSLFSCVIKPEASSSTSRHGSCPLTHTHSSSAQLHWDPIMKAGPVWDSVVYTHGPDL